MTVQATNPITGYANRDFTAWFCWEHRGRRHEGFDYPTTTKTEPKQQCIACAAQPQITHWHGCWTEHLHCAEGRLQYIAEQLAVVPAGSVTERRPHVLAALSRIKQALSDGA